MVYVVRSPLAKLALLVLPFIIFAVVYFTAIKPASDNANGALEDARERLKNTPAFTAPAGNETVEKTKAMADCMLAAGTDTSKLQECASQ